MSSLSWHTEFEIPVGYKEECPVGSLHGSGFHFSSEFRIKAGSWTHEDITKVIETDEMT